MTADPAADGGGTNTPPRARRFPVDGVVRYRDRARDASAWQRGTLINVSQSGVLFAAAEPPAPGAALELTLELASPLHATAVIARIGQARAGWFVGAKFDQLSFLENGIAQPARFPER